MSDLEFWVCEKWFGVWTDAKRLVLGWTLELWSIGSAIEQALYLQLSMNMFPL